MEPVAMQPSPEPLPVDYRWDPTVPHTHAYLIRPLLRLLEGVHAPASRWLALIPVPAASRQRGSLVPPFPFTRRQQLLRR